MADRRNGTGRPVIAECHETLPSELTSASVARHLLRDCLHRAGREDWLDAGELAISEIVSNALLHAHTEVEVRIAVHPDEVCVEVQDRNPNRPLQRHYDDEATTGRGMGLVAAVARSFGVRPLADGKAVWFCVGDVDLTPGADVVLDTWDVDGWDDDDASHRSVLLPAMPAMLWLSARQHHDAILRELVFYLDRHPSVDVDVASADRARGLISSAVEAAVAAAARESRAQWPVPGGQPSPWLPDRLDLRIVVPDDSGPTCFGALQDVLDLAEALAVDGHLFSRPGLPEIIAVRDWACEQVIAQLAGAPGAPWGGSAQERFETDVHDRTRMDAPIWDEAVVRESLRPAVAADDANRIIAVSPALTLLVGWDADDLVGRRVVTLIPPALREAHVAGFSRHLSTGEAHMLGIPMEVPVLARDGTEIPCRFLVIQVPEAAGRAVYVAWLDPLGGPID